MTLPSWHEEPISKSHRRNEFDCGDDEMNHFLHRYARQSHDQSATKTFCAIDDSDPGRVLGFYTIVPTSIEYERVPPFMIRGFARHDVGGFKLARIATDVRVTGHGLGSQLLTAAATRCIRASSEVGGSLFVIDAKNERAAAWYANFGAVALADRPLTLVIPMATLVAGTETRRSGGSQ